MTRYTLHVHFADANIGPISMEIDERQQLAAVFAVWVVPLIEQRKTSRKGGVREGVAWKFKVQREDDSWDELDAMLPIRQQGLPAGSTIHAVDITSALLK